MSLQDGLATSRTADGAAMISSDETVVVTLTDVEVATALEDKHGTATVTDDGVISELEVEGAAWKDDESATSSTDNGVATTVVDGAAWTSPKEDGPARSIKIKKSLLVYGNHAIAFFYDFELKYVFG